MSEGRAIVFLPCLGCGEMFAADVEDAESRVPSILVDPRTGLAPDVGGTDPEAAVRQPLCPTCFPLLLDQRRDLGKPDWPAPPGGWPAQYAEGVARVYG